MLAFLRLWICKTAYLKQDWSALLGHRVILDTGTPKAVWFCLGDLEPQNFGVRLPFKLVATV